jgi:hypothetical protein
MNINWHDVSHGPFDTIATAEHSAVPCTVAERDHYSRLGHGLERLTQGSGHVLRDRTRDHERVGMSGRRDQANPESLGVVDRTKSGGDFQLAAVARTGVDVADLNRSSECAGRVEKIGWRRTEVFGDGPRVEDRLEN